MVTYRESEKDDETVRVANSAIQFVRAPSSTVVVICLKTERQIISIEVEMNNRQKGMKFSIKRAHEKVALQCFNDHSSLHKYSEHPEPPVIPISRTSAFSVNKSAHAFSTYIISYASHDTTR